MTDPKPDLAEEVQALRRSLADLEADLKVVYTLVEKLWAEYRDQKKGDDGAQLK